MRAPLPTSSTTNSKASLRTRLNTYSLLFLLSLLSVAARGEIISIGLCPGGDDESLTYDSQTGLDWLDVPLTANRTYDQVRLGIWYRLGFRHATADELRTLFADAGTPDDGFDTSATYPEQTRALAEMLGLTIDQPGTRESTAGFVGTDFLGNPVTEASHPIGQPFSALLGKLDYLVFPDQVLGEAHFTGGAPFSDEADPSYGSFLVRPHECRPPEMLGNVPRPLCLLISAIAVAQCTHRD